MAANATDLVMKLSNEIQSLQNDLLEAIAVLKRRRATVEKHCARCVELFKPWPQRVSQPLCSTKIDAEKPKGQEQATCKTNAGDEKEKQELAMLDDILAKAQHARDIQSKLSKSTKRSSPSVKSADLSGGKAALKVSSAAKDSKAKPKVRYPPVMRPPSAKSTYAASYKKVPISKTKPVVSGTRNPPSLCSTSLVPRAGQPLNETKLTARNQSQNSSKTSNVQEKKLSSSLAPRKLSEIADEDSRNASTEPKFLLSEKGSLLKVPPNFLRICRNHKKLLERVREVNELSLKDSGENFSKRVEETFCRTLSSSSGQAVSERLDSIAKTYERLLGLGRSTFSTLQSINETTELEKISKCTTIWEFITSKHQQLKKEVNSLTKELSGLGHFCPFPEYHASSLDVLEHPGTCPANDVENYPSGSSLTSTLASFVTQKDFTFDLSDDDGFFTYQNSTELKMLQKLSHDYGMKRYQLELRKTIGEKILPLLRGLPTNHRLFIPLYRTVYSILCCDGRTFPTMVKDNFPDDELKP